jgi:hypothetical protein
MVAVMAAKDDAKHRDEDRRTGGMVAVAVPSEKVTRPVFGKHGFAGGALVVDWPAIVGSAVAAHTMPVRIKFPAKERGEGTLVIKVASSAFATELQHLEPLILERINGYFGWKAVSRLRLLHGPLPERRAKAPDAVVPAATPELRARLEAVEDPELREVLSRLGRRIAGSQPK